MAGGVNGGAPGAQGGVQSGAQAGEHLPAAGEFLLWPPNIQSWGYRIVDQLFASRAIERGPATRMLARGPETGLRYGGGNGNGGEGSSSARADAGEFTLDQFMERNHASGLMILRHGEVLFERYALGLREHDRWSTMSMVKSMTAMLTGIAVRDGAIAHLDDPVTRYLPALEGSAYDRVTVRHLLTMSTGTRWTEAYDDRDSDVNRYSRSLANRVPGGVLALMRELPAVAEPGARFCYNSGDSYLLGALVSAATGRRLADLMSERIWKPFGMEFDAFYTLECDGGQEIAGSRAGMALRDLARFALYVAADGVIDGRPTLPEGWVRDCGTQAYAVDDPAMRHRGVVGYGYCWWITDDGAMNALGFAGQRMWIDRASGLIAVILSAQPQPPYVTAAYPDFDAQTRALLGAVKQALG